MAQWYRAVKRRRVPQRLLDLEAAGPPQALVAHGLPEPPQATAQPRPSPAHEPETLATGYAATLDRLSRAEAVAAQRWADAVASNDPEIRAQASGLKKEWVDLAETVRAYERDRGKVLREADAIWDRQAVLEALASVHNVIAPGIRRLLRTCRRRYARVFASLPPEADALFADEADALFTVLLNSKFTSSAMPDGTDPVDEVAA